MAPSSGLKGMQTRVPQRTHALAEDEPAEGWRRAAPGPAGEQLVNAELRLKP
jgi:hypothetical protein